MNYDEEIVYRLIAAFFGDDNEEMDEQIPDENEYD